MNLYWTWTSRFYMPNHSTLNCVMPEFEIVKYAKTKKHVEALFTV